MNPLTRRNFLSGTGASLLAGSLDPRNAAAQDRASQNLAPNETQHPRASASRPNLVLFMPDELRADSLACYGNPIAKTPNFDRLAAQGTRFDQCHVSYPICGASRCSLLTGWPTSVRGHRSQQYFLRPEEPNLFRYLKQGGYDVFWFGKNDALAAQSFESSVTAWNFLDGKPVGPAAPAAARNPRNAAKPDDILPFLSEKNPADPKSEGDYVHLRAGIRVLERTQSDKPFCIFLPLTSPHPPYNAPGDFGTMYSPSDIPPPLPTNLPRRPDFMARLRTAYGMDSKTQADFRKIRAAYYGKVSYSDWLLGELMDALDRTNHARDTALFILSDHGDYAGDYGLVEKWPSGMEDCLTHIPMIARIPGGAANHVVPQQTEQFDAMASCLDLAGIPASHTHFARSLVPQLRGAAGDPRRGSFTEGGYNTYEPQCFEPEPPKGTLYYPRLHLHHTQPETVSRCASVKTAEYHFVSRPQGQSELYLLKGDPLQKDNVHGESGARAQQHEAEQRLLHWYINTTGVSPRGADSRDFPPYIPLENFPPNPSEAQIVDE